MHWLLVLAAVLCALVLLVLSRAIGVRDDLEDARLSMEKGRDLLLAGDATGATSSFERGKELFEAAAGGSRNPSLAVVGWIPGVGRSVDAVRAIADAGGLTAEAAIRLSRAVADVPGGLAGLAPRRGALPIDRIPPLADAAASADVLMADAVSEIDGAPDSLLVGPVAAARRTAEDELRGLARDIHAASSLLHGLPGFLGAEHPKQYFFGAQNPAELRGTGGIIGAYSILTIDRGRFRFEPFVPPWTVRVRPHLVSTSGDYAKNYEEFRGGDRYWSAINVMPDFPSVARVILDAYEAGTGRRLDGVIVADPFALAALLVSTGPVELDRYGVEIDADNVVDFTTNEAYGLFTSPRARKRILGDAAAAAFAGFMSGPAVGHGDLRTVLDRFADRHVLAYVKDPVMQEGLSATPVGGTLVPAGTDGDLMSVVVSSAAGSKVDFYQSRDISESVVLGEDGSAEARLDLTLSNDAPSKGQPPYVIGPVHPHVENRPGADILRSLKAGESVALVNVYCGATCVPRAARLDGRPTDVSTRVDLGVRYTQHYFSILSGEQRSLRLSWDEPDAWQGNSSGGAYRMTFANQTTIRPARVTIRIAPPPGMRIVSASAPMRITEGSAVYEGTPGSRLDLEIGFAPSLPVRLWRNVTRFLTKPVF